MWKENGNLDNCAIYLLAGTHIAESIEGWAGAPYNDFIQHIENNTGWFTISSAPGLDRSEVVLLQDTNVTNAYAARIKLFRFKNVTLRAENGSHYITTQPTARIWFDNCVMDGVDRYGWSWNSWPGSTAWAYGKYATGMHIKNTDGGPAGFTLVRNCFVDTIKSDAFAWTHFVVNCTVTDINHGITDAHPDIQQLTGNLQNVIAYRIRSINPPLMPNGVQGLFVTNANINGMAVVDCDFNQSNSHSQGFVLEGTINNLIVKDSIFTGNCNWGDNTSTSLVVFDNLTIPQGNMITPKEGVIYR
jgi:hypothetical protein